MKKLIIILDDNGGLSQENDFNSLEFLGLLEYLKLEVELKMCDHFRKTNFGEKQNMQNVKIYKSMSEIKIGDFVECTTINIQSKKEPFTIGKLYEVIDTYFDYRNRLSYSLKDNNGVLRHFGIKYRYFKAVKS